MERRLAVFIDFENIARSVRDRSPDERVDLRAILRALTEPANGDGLAHGPAARAVLKRAYGDWRQFGDYRSDLLQNGIEPVQVFASRSKNGSDIRIAIDAMEVACKMPEITDVALITGDSDFLSLVNRLRENGKLVTGLGVERNTSLYLVQSCDRFIFYDDIVESKALEEGAGIDDPRELLLEAVRRLSSRQGQPGLPPPGTPLKAAIVKGLMRRLNPAWSEELLGFASFQEYVLSRSDCVLMGRPPGAPDLFIAERGTVAEERLARALDGGGAALNAGCHEEGAALAEAAGPRPGGISERAHLYLRLLRRRRIRHVPVGERRRTIEVLYQTLEEAAAGGEALSLKEAKDRVHQWFEQNEPSVSWDSINNCVYHLFWTFCFAFAPAADDVPLWDRPVSWVEGTTCPEDVLRRCDRGLIQMIAQELPGPGRPDPAALAEALGDGDEASRAAFEELVAALNAGGRPGGGYREAVSSAGEPCQGG